MKPILDSPLKSLYLKTLNLLKYRVCNILKTDLNTEVCLNTKHFEICVHCSQIILMNRVGLSHHAWYVVSRRKHRCLLTMGFEHLGNFSQLNECCKRNS